MRIDTETRLCAVIGNPVAHSLSPAIHNAGFAASGLNYVYLAFHVEDVGACLAGMRAMRGFRGLSVTIPHKIAIMDHLDDIEPAALRVGSVNTVTNDNGRLIGASTDGPGTLRAFAEAGVSLEGRKVLFLGAGGAARAVAFAVAEEAAPACITILGRTVSRAAALAADVQGATGVAVTYGGLEAVGAAVAAHDVLIQATPVGMHGHAEAASPVPAGCLKSRHVVFDMVYRPLKPRLILEAEAAGCTTILGLEMLLNQAVLQYQRWTGVDAPVAAMRRALLEALGAASTEGNVDS